MLPFVVGGGGVSTFANCYAGAPIEIIWVWAPYRKKPIFKIHEQQHVEIRTCGCLVQVRVSGIVSTSVQSNVEGVVLNKAG